MLVRIQRHWIINTFLKAIKDGNNRNTSVFMNRNT